MTKEIMKEEQAESDYQLLLEIALRENFSNEEIARGSIEVIKFTEGFKYGYSKHKNKCL